MRQTWRWFGPEDTVSLSDIRQAGAQGIVTALHQLPAGVPWSDAAIATRQHEVAHGPDGPTGLTWEVVESLPVSDEIKTQTGDWRSHLDAYRASLEALARAGIETICYNFMPVLDWTRTDLHARMPHGGTAMRFDLARFAAFDLHILARPGATEDWDDAQRDAADRVFRGLDDAARADLARAVTMGLPGAAAGWSLDGLRGKLDEYDGVDSDRMRRHHVDFLSEVVPLAERLGLRLCCHPDDPPFALVGLPRVMSTAQDHRWLMAQVDSPAAGITLCTGSLGVRPDNDCVAIARECAPRIHFAHLRNVTREAETVPASFFEDEHLSGQTDMVAVIAVLLDEETRRRNAGRADCEIPMRPDHGQAILSDLGVGGQPGYPAVGRLKGLAELRGVMAALGARGAAA
jgi:mannonate dehydratase